MEFINIAVSINQDLFSHSNFKDKKLFFPGWSSFSIRHFCISNNYILYMFCLFYSSNNYVLTVYANEIIDEIEGFPPPAPYYIVQVA